MASSRDRQRKLARAKLDRQLARRAARAKRRRQIQAGIGAAVVLALIVLGSAWALGAFDSKPEPKAAEDVCLWTPQDAGANTNLKDVGTPPTTGLPTSGTRTMTLTTNQGAPITAELDLTSAPCAGASISHLAGKSFYDNTKCHEITAEGALRCGDPSGTGFGGPAYTFSNEDVPDAPEASPSASPAPEQPPAYPKGTVAMIGSPPGANGSQFLIFLKDFNPETPAYSIVGKVTGGLDVVEKIGALETVDNGNGAKVKPKTDVVIQSLTVGEPNAAPAASPSAG
ncbi:peptidyl-prolyl cis-trans isomerase B (cyclophilin B) [Micromonospora viridifaciens]|uniref:Peptidyl-prolyl cis-trans isomerase B (Cyclophilin B) n=1 Tax=Micromonospora viridifaciens TaxID=1881 RepID=A0A1C4Z149_MICVI|nr:peptidylprolyl isomerase [Micromonospora viridifaciens]SCF26688.1 peptidyl-prolyl cis-trans isomerase B (cyclophilin B) [Micromonospora viridifaciens]